MEIETTESAKLLNLTGCRLVATADGFRIAVWPDLDGPELRAAIQAVGLTDYPIVHLDHPFIADEYRIRICPERLPGENFSSWQTRATDAREIERRAFAA